VREYVPDIQLLLQVHDSLVMQAKTAWFKKGYRGMLAEALEVSIPYDDPLIIPWGLKASRKSWGDCTEVEW